MGQHQSQSVASQTYGITMLGAMDDIDYLPISREMIRTHKRQMPDAYDEHKHQQKMESFEKYHKELRQQVHGVPKGTKLSVRAFLNESYNPSSAWYTQISMINC